MIMEAVREESTQPSIVGEIEQSFATMRQGTLLLVEAGNGIDGDPVSRLAAVYESGNLSALQVSCHVGRLAVPQGDGLRTEVIQSFDSEELNIAALFSHFLEKYGQEYAAGYENTGFDSASPVMAKPWARLRVGINDCRGVLSQMKVEEEQEGRRHVFDFQRYLGAGVRPGETIPAMRLGRTVPTMVERLFHSGF